VTFLRLLFSGTANRETFQGRIYVLQQPLTEAAAAVFIDHVIKPQVQASATVYLQRTADMIADNLAAIDCIFNSEGGFLSMSLEASQRTP